MQIPQLILHQTTLVCETSRHSHIAKFAKELCLSTWSTQLIKIEYFQQKSRGIHHLIRCQTVTLCRGLSYSLTPHGENINLFEFMKFLLFRLNFNWIATQGLETFLKIHLTGKKYFNNFTSKYLTLGLVISKL